MSFKVLLADPDGGTPTVLFEIDDRRVERVGLSTKRGEAGGARIDPETTEVLITLDYAHVDGRPTIFDVEARQNQTLTGEQAQERVDELAELSSVTNTGDDTIMTGAVAMEHQRAVDAGEVDEDDDGIFDDDDDDLEDGRVERVQDDRVDPQEPSDVDRFVPTSDEDIESHRASEAREAQEAAEAEDRNPSFPSSEPPAEPTFGDMNPKL